MTSITITLPEERLAKLREIAARLNVTPEDLARVSIEELLTRPDETFKQAAEYVIQKNSDLYRRLT
jgi:predicted transcriptional regulator